jgi:2-oxoglutarate ferredoxin oxidoreductase subunit beta
MTYQRPSFRHPEAPVNELGYTRRDYEGSISTLCAGCGHDSISAAIIEAAFTLPLEPHRIAKMSGIGCSSKTPAYFLGSSHGFNSVHGRMPSVTTGANLANRDLVYIGVSGDGDTASIGMGQFAHVVRRNLNMTYIVENNGCYGLTKGQDSATADVGSKSKKGARNPYEPIDLVSVAIQLGATFVARSFSGDRQQLVPLIKAALSHKGFAFLDVISPCVTFNNHEGSTKSYKYAKESEELLHEIGFVPFYDQITVDYEPGVSTIVEMHDGSRITLKKLERDFDPVDKLKSLRVIREASSKGEFLTGLLYVDPAKQDFVNAINMHDQPLATLDPSLVRPPKKALEAIMESLR